MRSVRSVTIARPVSDTRGVGAVDRGGQHVGAEVADEVGRCAASWGAVVGLAVSTAVSPAALKTGAVTAATPGSARRASWTRCTIAGPPEAGSSTTTWIGPLNPGPKPAASWSKAMRWVVCGGGVAVVGHADAHAERRDGDGAQRTEADDGVADRVAADVVGPAAGDGLRRRAWRRGSCGGSRACRSSCRPGRAGRGAA